MISDVVVAPCEDCICSSVCKLKEFDKLLDDCSILQSFIDARVISREYRLSCEKHSGSLLLYTGSYLVFTKMKAVSNALNSKKFSLVYSASSLTSEKIIYKIDIASIT